MTRYGKRSGMTVHTAQPFNAESRLETLADGPLTPVDAFFVRNHGDVPEIDAAGWRLRVTGLVAHDLELSLADLRDGRFAETTVTATLQCAGNRRSALEAVRRIASEIPWGSGAMGTVTWRGASLAAVLVAAGVSPDAQHVAFVGGDRADDARPPQAFAGSIPLAKAMSPEVLLAWAMNDAPLTPVHGSPLRAVVPGYIGARSVKWLERIEVRAQPCDGFYQAVAYRMVPADSRPGRNVGFALGEMGLTADVLVPQEHARIPAGPCEVRGYAFAGGRRELARAELSIDAGASWQEADLLEDLGPWAWRLWRATIDLRPGAHELVVRAWDSAATTQPERPETVWNPKGYMNNAWARVRVTVFG